MRYDLTLFVRETGQPDPDTDEPDKEGQLYRRYTEDALSESIYAGRNAKTS